MSVAVWLDYVDTALKLSPKNASISLSNLFIIDANIPIVSSLQNNVLDDAIDIRLAVEGKNFNDGDWASFEDLCVAYLTFTQSVDPGNPRDSYNSLIQYVTALQVAFTNIRGSILQGVLKSTLSSVLNMSKQLDLQDNLQRTNYLSTLLLKTFNNIRAEKTLDTQNGTYLSKKNIILFVANMLCRSYYILKTESSCANVFSNIHTAKLKFSSYSKSEQVEYRYFLGRFYLSKEQLSRAFDHLTWAFKNCLSNTPQQRLILKYLISASMLLGKLPSEHLLSAFDLTRQYSPLVKALKTGNYAAFMRYLEGPCKEWYIRNHLMFLFKSRAPIILLRQLMYKIYVFSGNNDTLTFSTVQFALALSMANTPNGWYDETKDKGHEMTENVFITLIHQGFIKGNIYTRRGVVKLRDKSPFPAISEVHHLNSQTLYPLDQWLEN